MEEGMVGGGREGVTMGEGKRERGERRRAPGVVLLSDEECREECSARCDTAAEGSSHEEWETSAPLLERLR